MPRTTVKQLETKLRSLEGRFVGLCADVSGTCKVMTEDSKERTLNIEHFHNELHRLDVSLIKAHGNTNKLWAKHIALVCKVEGSKRPRKYKRRGLLRRIAYKLYSSVRYVSRRLI